MTDGTEPRPGTVFLVGAGPGDPGLITVRGAECVLVQAAGLYDLLDADGHAVPAERAGQRTAFPCQAGQTYHWVRRPHS